MILFDNITSYVNRRLVKKEEMYGEKEFVQACASDRKKRVPSRQKYVMYLPLREGWSESIFSPSPPPPPITVPFLYVKS